MDLKSSINDFWRIFNRRNLNNDTSVLELRIIGNAPSIISLAESPSKSARFHLIFETIPTTVAETTIKTISDTCDFFAIWHKMCVYNWKISDHQQSWRYEDGLWKGPGPPLLVVADF